MAAVLTGGSIGCGVTEPGAGKEGLVVGGAEVAVVVVGSGAFVLLLR
ncbi:unnamed protein product, partial [Dibothriocephalus latus]